MNPEKAREYFSSHYEGTLERGLASALERKLQADTRVREEYEAFCNTMSSLESLRNPVPDPTFDLHERIASRLDRHVWEQKRKQGPAFLAFWRGLALGGLAAVAIVGTILQMRSRGDLNEAAMFGTFTPGQVQLASDGNELVLAYRSSGPDQITFRDETGLILESKQLNRQTIRSPLTNRFESASIVEIKLESASDPTYVAIPGSARTDRSTGKGTLRELALAFADHYRTPVALRCETLDVPVTWTFESADGFAGMRKALDPVQFTVEKRQGVLWIEGL